MKQCTSYVGQKVRALKFLKGAKGAACLEGDECAAPLMVAGGYDSSVRHGKCNGRRPHSISIRTTRSRCSFLKCQHWTKWNSPTNSSTCECPVCLSLSLTSSLRAESTTEIVELSSVAHKGDVTSLGFLSLNSADFVVSSSSNGSLYCCSVVKSDASLALKQVVCASPLVLSSFHILDHSAMGTTLCWQFDRH